MNVLFFGGSFDPPHVAHVLCVTYALSVGEFERVLVVPVFEHAFGKRLCPFEERVKMCELAFSLVPRVEVCRVEAELASPSYTLTTLEHLGRQHPDWRLRLLVGSDVLGDTSKWYRFDDVARLAPPFVVSRAGFGQQGLLPDVSSTRVRELLAVRGRPEVDEELARLVPRTVLEAIDARGLYRSPP
ncbi:MAG TPA: nicotinate-nicotinamide nucleotide adenylyltransferase [Polyangiaceae bacterium]|jgi:nicotinate-nucleotide adenylyltransferase|nr:nicotinate-nicotinamide nucleotide adenylyltransferase [Polyangiaceae bacterium]